jgi:hypothetical protein
MSSELERSLRAPVSEQLSSSVWGWVPSTASQNRPRMRADVGFLACGRPSQRGYGEGVQRAREVAVAVAPIWVVGGVAHLLERRLNEEGESGATADDGASGARGGEVGRSGRGGETREDRERAEWLDVRAHPEVLRPRARRVPDVRRAPRLG